jgi:signal transduction histidine kinase
MLSRWPAAFPWFAHSARSVASDGLRRAAIIGVAALAALLAAVGLLAVRYASQQHAARVWIGETERVIKTVHGLTVEITDAEIAHHNYVLTGDAGFLAVYRSSLTAATTRLAKLEQLLTDNPAEETRALELARLLPAEFAKFDDVLRLAQEAGRDAALQRLQPSSTHPPMQRVRALANELIRAEESLLRTRQEDATLIERRTVTAAMFAAGLALLLIVFGGDQLLREIQRRQRLAAELQVAKEQAERAVAAKSRFLAAASHDLKQPMTVLMGTLDCIRRAGDAPPDPRHLDRAETCVVQLAQALDQLLEVARLDTGARPPRWQEFDVEPLLRRLVESCEPLAEQKHLRLRMRAPRGLAVRSDPEMLTTVLNNLVGNAIKYTRRGGVLVAARRRRDAVLIQVIDTGVGIPEDQREAIFEEFRQLEPQHSEGVGLGLSIVKRTLGTLGHRIFVRSVAGKGTSFTVELPRRR